MHNAAEQYPMNPIMQPDAFADWVKQSIEVLGRPPSKFLLDPNLPGSKNRVAFFLRSPGSTKLITCHMLSAEIIADAAAKGIELPPIQPQK